MNKENFFDVPRTYYTTSYTRTQVPMFFFKLATRILNYFVDYDRVVPLMKGTGLVPCKFFNGKAIVSLIFYNYQDVTIGPYDEVTITIVCYPELLKKPKLPLSTVLFKKNGKNWGNLGAYVLEMPVTIPAARAAGREIWGYPKFLTRIPYKLSENSFEFGVLDPDTNESIVSVKGETGIGIKTKAFDYVSFNNYEDAIWKVIVDVDGKVKNCLCKSLELKVGPSKHRMAQNIRALNLENLKPIAVMSTDKCMTKLNAGKPVAQWKSPELPYQHPDEIEYKEEMKRKSR